MRKRKVIRNYRSSPNIGHRLIKCVKPIPRFNVIVAEKARNVFSNDDIAIEIFSRLPVESITELKLVCKRWFQILCHPFFRSAHFQMSPKNLSGLLLQATFFCTTECSIYFDMKEIDDISFGRDGEITVRANTMDFLPENVVVIASCNGILLCRRIFEALGSDHCVETSKEIYDVAKEVVLYVCNPFTREFTSVKPEGKYYNGCCYGFVCDSSGVISFEIIMIQCPLEREKEPYLFAIYSSKTGTWRLSKEVCYFAERIYLHHNWYADGVFYWLVTDYYVLAFDLKEDIHQVIKLPGVPLWGDQRCVCLGVSEGKLHYICFNADELLIWILEYDRVKPKWSLKHFKRMVEIDAKASLASLPSSYRKYRNAKYTPIAIEGEILFMREYGKRIVGYNIETGKIDREVCSLEQLTAQAKFWPLVIPYCKSILQVPSEKTKETAM